MLKTTSEKNTHRKNFTSDQMMSYFIILYVCEMAYVLVQTQGENNCLSVTDVAMPVRAVCKPHSPHLKKRRSSD